MNDPKKKKQQHPFLTRALNLTQLAEVYSVSRPTMRKWIRGIIDELGRVIGKLYNVRQQRIMYDNFGPPAGHESMS